MKKVSVIVFEQCMACPPLTTYELLSRVNGMARGMGKSQEDVFEVSLVACSKKKTIVTSDGLKLTCHSSLSESLETDLIVVPAFEGDVLEQLNRTRVIIPWLRSLYEKGVDIVSICTGAFALAEAGLLDGRSASTHWASHDLFRSRYPKVSLKPHLIVVDEGRVITSGGAFSFLNLIIYLVEKFLGHDVALLASRMFLIDFNKSPQGSYAIFNTQKNHKDNLVLKTQKIIEEELKNELSVEYLAEKVSLSRRQLVRRFKTATGNNPWEYIQRVRVEAAKKALIETDSRLEDIAWDVGYSDIPGFRKVFIRFSGLSPSEYRRKYNSANFSSVLKEFPSPKTKSIANGQLLTST